VSLSDDPADFAFDPKPEVARCTRFGGVLFCNSVRGCPERRIRSSRPEGRKIDGDLEVHDCKVGSTEAGRK
jgi:hypothetical protein